MIPYEDGYYAGLVYDRTCPYSVFDPRRIIWLSGNLAGVIVHCAIVEAVYCHGCEE